ncbi:MAG: HTH domain-containing protein, partial [Butyrivibrio sp.]|nr:HTH domain-containing protein [Butyrivibrio sp.]
SRDISDNIKPSIWYEIQTKYADDGKSFIEIIFNGSNSPYSAYGKYYQRFADEDKQILDSELERLFKARQKDYSEWENADSTETVSDVDENLLKKVIADGNESGRIKYEYTDVASILSKLGLYNTATDMLTNAGKTLFSSNHPVLLKTAVYATETKDTFIKLNHFEGNIFECIDEGISFIMSAINWNVAINGNSKRNEEPEIPQAAIREMVVNAFAHGCYYTNTTFAVEVFRDKVMIYSPGNFPFGFTPEDFANNAAEPIMLNPKIVNVLFKAAVIESFGTGYERTFAACQSAGVEYEYENTKTGFKFVFHRPLGHKNVQEMTKSEKVVYEHLKECDYLTIARLAIKIGRSEKTAYRAIKGLKEKGYVEREGNDANGYWKILR